MWVLGIHDQSHAQYCDYWRSPKKEPLLLSLYGWLPHLPDASNQIHTLQQSNELCLQENCTRTICFQDIAHQTSIFNEWIFMECMHIFITLCSTVSTINVSTQVKPHFVHKMKKVQHIKSFTHKSTKSLEILNSCRSITCYKLTDI